MNNPLKYSDPNGENPLFIFVGFLLAKWYYDGYTANNGQWNPVKWNWQNANFMIGYSSQGNMFSFGTGWNNSFSIVLGYNSNQGLGIGYSYNGNTTLYYQGYDNRVNDAITRSVNNVVHTVEEWGNSFYESLTWDNFLNALPVYGSCRTSSDAFSSGDYLAGIADFGVAAIDMFTLGAGSKISLGLKSAEEFVETGYRSLRVAEEGVQYTKSSLKMGQEMHKAYKVGEDGVKEFRLPSGKRIDFLDINNRAIYELKPYNPRGIQQGQQQLQMYWRELQTIPEYNGYKWRLILDLY